MLSIKNMNIYTYMIKNSKFISIISKIDTEEDIKRILEDIRNEYPLATHYCYGYILDNDKRYNDDREPSKTAGMPILNVLEGYNLNHVIIVVVRYFGGIKLGTGLLTRTYSKVAKEVIVEDNIIELTKGYNITITFNYEEIKSIDYLLRDSQILTKEYQDNIIYNVNINKGVLDSLHSYNIKINKEIYIEKNK